MKAQIKEKGKLLFHEKMMMHNEDLINTLLRPLLTEQPLECNIPIYNTTDIDCILVPNCDEELIGIATKIYIDDNNEVCATIIFNQGQDDETTDEWTLKDYYYSCVAQIVNGLYK